MTLTKLLAGISPVALMIGTAGLVHAEPILAEAPASTTDTSATTAPAADPDGQDRTITVTATRTEKAVEDVPATVSVIDAQTIQDRFISDI